MAKNPKAGIKELRNFAIRLDEAANRDLKRQYTVWLEAIGMEFLGIVHDNIIRLGVVDTRRLLNSFNRGNKECIFELNDSKLVLKVGSNVEYAALVNNGHYIGSKKTSIITKNGRKINLRKIGKRKWWEGYHYFDISITHLEKIIETSMERKLLGWLRQI